MDRDDNYLYFFLVAAFDYYSRHPNTIVKLLREPPSQRSGVRQRAVYDEPEQLFFVSRQEVHEGMLAPVVAVDRFSGESSSIEELVEAMEAASEPLVLTLENLSPANPDCRMVYGWRIHEGMVAPLPEPVMTADEWAIMPGALFDGQRLEIGNIFVDQITQLINIAPVGHHLMIIMSPMSMDSIVTAALQGNLPAEVDLRALFETFFLEFRKPHQMFIYTREGVRANLGGSQAAVTGHSHITVRSVLPDGAREVRCYASDEFGKLHGLTSGSTLSGKILPSSTTEDLVPESNSDFRYREPW